MVLSGIAFAVVSSFTWLCCVATNFITFLFICSVSRWWVRRYPWTHHGFLCGRTCCRRDLTWLWRVATKFSVARHSELITLFCTLNSPRFSLWSHVLQTRLDMALVRCHQFIMGHLHAAILHGSTALPPIHLFIPSFIFFLFIFLHLSSTRWRGRWYPWNHHGFLYDCECCNGPYWLSVNESFWMKYQKGERKKKEKKYCCSDHQSKARNSQRRSGKNTSKKKKKQKTKKLQHRVFPCGPPP